jgi:predicted permease
MPHHVVLAKIVVVLLLFGAGWLLRTRRLLDGAALPALSRLVVDVTFPALVLVQLPRTVDPDVLRTAWVVPAAGVVVIAGGMLVGRLLTRSSTGAFLVGLPNWIFLPLLIGEGLFGAAGVRTVLLFNVGAQVVLWTLGVVTVGGRAHPAALLRNPGLVATGVGLLLALAVPAAGELARGGGGGGAGALAARALIEALDLLGSITVPLSVVVTGAQLADQRGGGAPAELLRVLLGRLLVLPALVGAGLAGVAALGAPLARPDRVLLLVIAAMPVALSGSLFAQRYGGDTALASRAVLVSTTSSLLTVPALVWALG